MPRAPHIIVTVLAVAACVIVADNVVTNPIAYLNRTAAERFIDANPVLEVPGVGDARFRCTACRTYFHRGFFTAYMSVSDDRRAELVVSVHPCLNHTSGGFVPCAVERRNFPVFLGVLNAVDVALAAFEEPLFHNQSAAIEGGNGTVPNALNAGVADVAQAGEPSSATEADEL